MDRLKALIADLEREPTFDERLRHLEGLARDGLHPENCGEYMDARRDVLRAYRETDTGKQDARIAALEAALSEAQANACLEEQDNGYGTGKACDVGQERDELKSALAVAKEAQARESAYCKECQAKQEEHLAAARERIDELSFPKEYIPPGPEREAALKNIPVVSAGEGRKLKHSIKLACMKDRKEFADWLDGMVRQGLAKQTKAAEVQEMFMPSFLLEQYEALLNKEEG